MHAGVGRLLLGSELRDGGIRAEATRRTAFVIAGGHALTARHCSADATAWDPLWLRLPAPDDEFGTVDLPVRVRDEDAALDVAVLEVDPGRAAGGDTSADSAAGLLSRVPPLTVGLPAAAGDPIRTEGYPWDARDGGLAFGGKVVDPDATLRRSRAHALQLQIDELAASVPHGPGGHSGGPVLNTGTGSVAGVVRAYPPDETRDYAVGGSLLASRMQDLAARFPAVREAFAHRAAEVLGLASPATRAVEKSLATLIRADARHTRFFGREPELGRLDAWCTSDAARAAMLMTGPAGQGKTRLGRRFCEQLAATGEWVAATLRGVGGDGEITDGLRLAALAGRPLLLAVDYAAEYGARALLALVDQLCAHGPPSWRLLLIARHAGDWWDGDTRAVQQGLRAAGVEVAREPLRLAELVAAHDDRPAAYQFILGELREPVTAFAKQHDLSVSPEPPTPPLQRPEYGSALMLHIAAVCALVPGSGPGARSAVPLDPTKVVDRFLDLERDHHWLYRDSQNLHHTTAQAFGDLATGEAGRYLVETAATAATLTGAADEVQAGELVRTALRVEPRQAEKIAYWLRDLYPPPTETAISGILHPLQPDLLGEELLARVLRRELDSGRAADELLPFALIAISSEAQIQRMLTVLIRTAERHAWIADLLAGPDDTSARRRGGLLNRVPAATDLGIVENALPRQNTHLLWVAAQLTQRLLDRLGPPNGTGRSAAAEAARARLLNNLGIRLSNLGRREEALTATTEAVQIRRRLAGVNPAAFEPDLAMSLNNLGVRLSNLGRREEALPATTEAVQIRRRLAGVNPAAFEPDLAMSLNNLGIRLSNLGRREEALTATTEAVEIRRRLAGVNPAAFEPDLARGLWALAWVRAAGQVELSEALNAAEESVGIYERLVERLPQAFASDLRGALTTLADVLDALGRNDEAAQVRDRSDRLR